MTGKCGDCALWIEGEGRTYCKIKALNNSAYRFTDANKVCNEADWRCRTLFTPKRKKPLEAAGKGGAK